MLADCSSRTLRLHEGWTAAKYVWWSIMIIHHCFTFGDADHCKIVLSFFMTWAYLHFWKFKLLGLDWTEKIYVLYMFNMLPFKIRLFQRVSINCFISSNNQILENFNNKLQPNNDDTKYFATYLFVVMFIYFYFTFFFFRFF